MLTCLQGTVDPEVSQTSARATTVVKVHSPIDYIYLRVRSRAVPCVTSGSRPLHSTLFIARQTRSDLLRCKCSHPLSHDRLIQIPLYFMLQYCSLGYQWVRINNPAVLLVYSSGRPRPIVIQVAIRELSQRLGRG